MLRRIAAAAADRGDRSRPRAASTTRRSSCWWPRWSTQVSGGVAGALVGGRCSRWSAELVGGAVIGVAIGFAGAWAAAPRPPCPWPGFYPLATLALCVLAFASASLVHTSGFVAVYLCGVVLGNVPLPHRSASIGFAEGMASLAQIGLFVLLGLLASPARLADALGACAASSAARCCWWPGRCRSWPASSWFRIPWRAAGVHLVGGAARRRPDRPGHLPADRAACPGRLRIFDTVFVLVVVFTVVQGGSLPWVARRLGIARAGRCRARCEVESAPLDELDADLHAGHRAARVPAARGLPARAAAARGRRRRARSSARGGPSCPTTRPGCVRGDQALLVVRPPFPGARPSAGCARSAGRPAGLAGAARPAHGRTPTDARSRRRAGRARRGVVAW